MLVAPAAKLDPARRAGNDADGWRAGARLNFETLIVPGGACFGLGCDEGSLAHKHALLDRGRNADGCSFACACWPRRSRCRQASQATCCCWATPFLLAKNYPELPFASTRILMQQIERHFAAHDEAVFVRVEVPLPLRIWRADPAHYSYIHFVSHGVRPAAPDPLDSAIILSRAGDSLFAPLQTGPRTILSSSMRARSGSIRSTRGW